MTIDHISIRLYTCCKCGNRWTNWDSKNKTDGRIPLNCSSCRNIRWNIGYTKEDLVLVERLEEQHMIKKDAEVRRTDVESGRYYTPPYYSRDVSFPPDKEIKWDYFDFIAYDFLYMMLPQPEIFEIKQVLSIQKSKMEQRHELMLSMIHDRIKNAEKYHKEHFPKLTYARKKRTLFEVYSKDGQIKYHEIARRRMKGCNHKEDLEILMALYKVCYYGGEEGFKMYEPEHLSEAEAQTIESIMQTMSLPKV